MEKDIQRRNVIDVLRSMDVGAIEVFPIVQKPSVTNTLNARLYKEKAEGMAWKTKSDVSGEKYFIAARWTRTGPRIQIAGVKLEEGKIATPLQN